MPQWPHMLFTMVIFEMICLQSTHHPHKLKVAWKQAFGAQGQFDEESSRGDFLQDRIQIFRAQVAVQKLFHGGVRRV